MKIALLTEKYTPDIGGLAISSERFARSLSSAGCTVRVFSPSPNLPSSEKQTLGSYGVSVTRFGVHKRMDDTLVDWFELIVEEHKHDPFDILHAYFLPQAGFVAAYAGKYLNIPSVVSIRGNDIERASFDPSRFSHVMYALQNASAVTTNATELVKKAKAFLDREIYLVRNGVDTEHFKPIEKNLALAKTLTLTHSVIPSVARNLSSVREDSSATALPHIVPMSFRESDIVPVIGFVGELREKKGLKNLLSACVQVNKVRPAALLIVGEVRQGEDIKTFEEFRSLKPELNIIVTGYVPPKDLPAYYSLIDIFVHPSLRDGMPNAVLEAMACEKPVIATPVGGVSDVLENGKNGITFNVNDTNMLAEKILELLDDPEKRSKLGKTARELMASKFTLEKELKANLEIYRKLGLSV